MRWILYEVNRDGTNAEDTAEVVDLPARPSVGQALRVVPPAGVDFARGARRGRDEVESVIEVFEEYRGAETLEYRLVREPVPDTQVPLLSARFPMGGGR